MRFLPATYWRVLILVLLSLCLVAPSHAQNSIFKKKNTWAAQALPVDQPWVTARTSVQVVYGRMNDATYLFDPFSETFTVTQTHYISRAVVATSDYAKYTLRTMHGEITDDQSQNVGYVVLTFLKDTVTKDKAYYGVFKFNDGTEYILRHASDSTLVLDTIDNTISLPPELGSLALNSQHRNLLSAATGDPEESLLPGAPSSGPNLPLNIITGYTLAAEAGAGGSLPMLALMQNSVSYFNYLLSQQGVDAYISLNVSYKLLEIESGFSSLELLYLKDETDTAYDSFLSTKTNNAAHFVTTFTTNSDYCGAGYVGDIQENDDYLSPPWMLTTINYRCHEALQSQLSNNLGGVSYQRAHVVSQFLDGSLTPGTRSYVLSGTITNGAGLGVSGVSVDGGSLGVSITDSTGYYAFNNVERNTAYTLTPTESADALGFSPVAASGTMPKGDVTENFTVNGAPQITPIPDQIGAAGATLAIQINASDPELEQLTYSAEVFNTSMEVYDLDQIYNFYPSQNGEYLNTRGSNEKYFRGNDALFTWFFILPNGELYQHTWDGIAMETPELELLERNYLATLPTAFYDDLTLFYDVATPSSNEPITVSFSGDTLNLTPESNFIGYARIEVSVSDSSYTQKESFNLYSKNDPPIVSEISDQNITHGSFASIPVTAVDPEEGELTFNCSVSPVQEAVYTLDQTYDFYIAPQGYYENARGAGEKYIRGAGGSGWFYMLPSGDLYELLGAVLSESTHLGTFPDSYFSDPSKFVDAEYTASGEWGLGLEGINMLFTPPLDFSGEAYANVVVSDGLNTVQKDFYITVSNTAPSITATADLAINHGVSPAIDIVATDSESPSSLIYSAIVIDVTTAAHTLDQSYDFYVAPQGYFENARGSFERYIRGTGGSTWFFILPNGEIYDFTGSGLSDSTLIGTLPTGYYDNPALFVDVSAPIGASPATASFVNNSLTISPNLAFEGTFQIEVTVSDGAESSVDIFDVTVNNTAPVQVSIPDRILPHGQIEVISLDITDPEGLSLTINTTVSDLGQVAYALDSSYDFYVANQGYYTDARGQGEKYLRGQSGSTWFYILPNGELYELLGSVLSESVFLGTLPQTYYDDPSLLVDVLTPGLEAPATAEINASQLTLTPNLSFVGTFEVQITAFDGAASSNQTFFVTVTNQSPQFTPFDDLTVNHGATFDLPISVTDPEGLTLEITTSVSDLADDAYTLDQVYDFYLLNGGEFFLDARGSQEKYIRGVGGSTWFFILPNGQLYDFDGTGLTDSTFIGTFPVTYYNNPALFVDIVVPAGLVPAVATVNGTNLNIATDYNFTGTLKVDVEAFDGADTSVDSFFITAVNTAPVFTQTETVIMASTELSRDVTLVAIDNELDPLTFSANVSSESGLAASLDAVHDFSLNPAGFLEDGRGAGERYIRGTQGTTWYYVLPNGELYQFVSTLENSILLASFSQSYYNDPSRFVDVSTGGNVATISILNNVVTITPDPSFQDGTLVVTANVTDGLESDTMSFLVTIASSSEDAQQSEAFSTTELDSDLDGVTDSQEALDGTNPYDSGSFTKDLTGPVYSLWNGFLEMTNILEIINPDGNDKVVTVEFYANDGVLLNTLPVLVSAKSQVDVILNDLSGFENNSYGLVKLSFDGTLEGRVVFYRPGLIDGFEFAYGLDIDQPLNGKSSISYNTFHPSDNVDDHQIPVSNWLTIVNLDDIWQNFDIYSFDESGEQILHRNIWVAPKSRLDLDGGHDFAGPNQYGTHIISPNDSAASYLAQVIRYGTNSDGTYSFAVPFPAKKPNGETVVAPVSNFSHQANWVEIMNSSSVQQTATIKFVNKDGQITRLETLELSAYQQAHLLSDTDGFVEVSPEIAESMTVYSVYYYKNITGSIDAVTVLAAEEPERSLAFGSYNSFLGMNNYLKLGNPSGAQSQYKVLVNNTELMVTLQPGQATQLSINDYVPADSYGSVIVEPINSAVFFSTIFRERTTLDFAFIVPLR